jgi:regulator of protease activity HflC (stomatin/prohibitin superfamily)
MHTPGVTLKLRKFRRRFGIAAPKVVVRTHLPWQWLAVPAVLLLLLVGVAGWLIAQRNEAGAMALEIDRLHRESQSQLEELKTHRLAAGAGQSAASIERASQQQLLERIRGLEAQNAALREDVLLYDRLIPVTGDVAAVRVESFRVVQEAEGRFHYRILLGFQPDRQATEFRGVLRLAINYSEAGKKMQLLLPDKSENLAEYQLQFKHFLRREGVFELPAMAVLQGVEARVLQGDALKYKKMAQF